MASDFEKNIEQVKTLLWEPRLGYLLLYDVQDDATLRFSRAVSRNMKTTDEEYRKLGATFQEQASRCYEARTNGFIQPESFRPTNPPNSEGLRWWGFIIAKGAIARARFAIVVTILARSKDEIVDWMTKIQRIMEA
jgi:hypothetical protein